MEFTLPSGRVLTIKERPNYGEICDAQDEAFATKRLNAYVQHLIGSQTNMTPDDARALSPEDGKALEDELMRRARPLEKAADEPPFPIAP